MTIYQRFNQIYGKDWKELRVALLVSSLVIAVFVAATVYYLESLTLRQGSKEVEIRLSTLLDNISIHLAHDDYQMVIALVDDFVGLENVVDLVVRDHSGKEIVGNLEAMNSRNNSSRYIQKHLKLNDGNGSIDVLMENPDYGLLIVNALWHTLFVFGLAFVSCWLIFRYFMFRYIASPIEKLADAMQETLRTGEYHEVPNPDDTLLGRMAENFNQMQRQNIERTEECQKALEEAQSFSAQLQMYQSVYETALRGTGQYAVFTELETGERIGDTRISGFIGKIFDANPQSVEELSAYIDNSIGGNVESMAISSETLPELVPSQDMVDYICEVELSDASTYIISKISISDTFAGILVTDITSYRLKREKVFQVQKLEAIGSLASGVAHDFNNILAIIHGLADLNLAGRYNEGNTQAAFRKILNLCQRAATVIDQLMLYSTLKPETNKSPVNLYKCLSNSTEMYRTILGPKIELLIDVPDDHWIMGNEDILISAIINLCKNSAKAIPNNGKVEIVSRLAKKDFVQEKIEVADGEWLHLEIADNGVGIDSHSLNKIFEPFFSTHMEEEGQGLGLMMVNNAMQSLGGHIWCESLPGDGATFHVLLPRISPPMIDYSDVAGKVDNISPGVSICLVEDEELLLDVMAEFLSDLGYQVIKFTAFTSALDYFARDGEIECDILVSDARLMDGEGQDLIAIAKQIKPEIGCILISGQIDQSDSAMADCFLKKPFELDELVLCIEEMITVASEG